MTDRGTYKLFHLLWYNFVVLEICPSFVLLSDLTLAFLQFAVMVLSVLTSSTSTLHLLLTAELVWITLFGFALMVGVMFNNLNLLSLTFFFLIFSAVEFGVGLVLLLMQNIITRSIYLTNTLLTPVKFVSHFKTSVYTNRINWKY